MKKIGLTILCLLGASYPAMAKILHHHHYSHHVYRNARSSAHDDHTGVTPRAHLTCDMVRAYVAQVGLEQALSAARAAGMTVSEEHDARHCMESKT